MNEKHAENARLDTVQTGDQQFLSMQHLKKVCGRISETHLVLIDVELIRLKMNLKCYVFLRLLFAWHIFLWG